MRYLGSVDLVCDACAGRRFHPDVLAVRLDGLSIADVLAGSIEDAARPLSRPPEARADPGRARRPRPRVPPARAARDDALGRRGAAGQARDRAREGDEPGARRPRRADDRPPRGRRGGARRGVRAALRGGAHAPRGRPRPRPRPRGRPDHRARSRQRPGRRPGRRRGKRRGGRRLRRGARRAPRFAASSTRRPLPARAGKDGRRGALEASARDERASSSRASRRTTSAASTVDLPRARLHRRHRAVRLGQVVARLRHAPRRVAGALRRPRLPLGAPVPPDARRRRARVGARPPRRGRRPRARGAAQPARDRRDGDGDRRAPSPPLRAGRNPALSPLRPGRRRDGLRLRGEARAALGRRLLAARRARRLPGLPRPRVREACDPERLVGRPDLPLDGGALDGTRFGAYLGEADGQHVATLRAAAAALGVAVSGPWRDLSPAARRLAMDGRGRAELRGRVELPARQAERRPPLLARRGPASPASSRTSTRGSTPTSGARSWSRSSSTAPARRAAASG